MAACSQMGDIGRAFESFEAYKALGLRPDAQAFNAVLIGCIAQGVTQPVPKASLPGLTKPLRPMSWRPDPGGRRGAACGLSFHPACAVLPARHDEGRPSCLAGLLSFGFLAAFSCLPGRSHSESNTDLCQQLLCTAVRR